MLSSIGFLKQTAPGGQAPSSGFMQLLPFIAIFAIFYFLLIAPMRKRQKKTQQMLRQLKKGDQVVTTGGIYGRVSAIDETTNTVILQIADTVKIKVARNSVAGLAGEGEPSASP